jgi:hypothetical protein
MNIAISPDATNTVMVGCRRAALYVVAMVGLLSHEKEFRPRLEIRLVFVYQTRTRRL